MLDPVGHPRPERPILLRGVATASPRLEIATQILTGLALLGALQFDLLASLLAGLLVYELVHVLAPGHDSTFVRRHTGKVIVVARCCRDPTGGTRGPIEVAGRLSV